MGSDNMIEIKVIKLIPLYLRFPASKVNYQQVRDIILLRALKGTS